MAEEHDELADELIRAVEILADVFAANSIRYALIGGLATLLRGRPRFTQDVDLLLDVPQFGGFLLCVRKRWSRRRSHTPNGRL